MVAFVAATGSSGRLLPASTPVRVLSARRGMAVRAAAVREEREAAARAPALLCSAGGAALTLGLAAAAHAAGAEDNVGLLEKELTQSFAVDLGGYMVDHKTLIYGVFVGQWVALVGAAVGGWTARQRSMEVEDLNAKIVETNRSMRKQMNRDVECGLPLSEAQLSEDTGEECESLQLLKQGKRQLKERKAVEARASFDSALASIEHEAEKLDEPWRAERKARRGLGAAYLQMKDFPEAETNLLRVVELCEHNLTDGSERPELADAYGVLADMYTEWGRLDQAAEIYDKMILEMSSH